MPLLILKHSSLSVDDGVSYWSATEYISLSKQCQNFIASSSSHQVTSQQRSVTGCLADCHWAKSQSVLHGVQAASRQIAKQSSVMDAQLFTIKQLLILREQIAPFEADFAVTEYDLDFSHMRDHLRRIMAGMHPPAIQTVHEFIIYMYKSS